MEGYFKPLFIQTKPPLPEQPIKLTIEPCCVSQFSGDWVSRFKQMIKSMKRAHGFRLVDLDPRTSKLIHQYIAAEGLDGEEAPR